MKVGDFYKHKDKDFPCEVMGFPENVYSDYHKSAETEMILLKYHGGRKGTVQMILEEFKELYRPYKIL